MNRNLKTLAVVFSVALNVTFIVAHVVQNLRGRPRFVYEELDLRAGQRAQFEAERERFLRTHGEFGNWMIQRHAELMDLLAAETVNETAIQAKLDEIHANHRALQQIVVQHLRKDREVLDPDQRRQFFSVLKERINAQGAPGPAWVPRGERRRE
jgi:Spy/CpxP family protein refolding chaperone